MFFSLIFKSFNCFFVTIHVSWKIYIILLIFGLSPSIFNETWTICSFPYFSLVSSCLIFFLLWWLSLKTSGDLLLRPPDKSEVGPALSWHGVLLQKTPEIRAAIFCSFTLHSHHWPPRLPLIKPIGFQWMCFFSRLFSFIRFIFLSFFCVFMVLFSFSSCTCCCHTLWVFLLRFSHTK